MSGWEQGWARSEFVHAVSQKDAGVGSEQQRAGAGGGGGWLCGWRRSRAKRRPRHHDQAHVSRHTCVVPPGLRPVSGASLKHKTCTVPLTRLAHRPRPARSGDIPASLVLRVSSIATASICKRRPLHLLQGHHQDTVHWAQKPQASSWVLRSVAARYTHPPKDSRLCSGRKQKAPSEEQPCARHPGATSGLAEPISASLTLRPRRHPALSAASATFTNSSWP